MRACICNRPGFLIPIGTRWLLIICQSSKIRKNILDEENNDADVMGSLSERDVFLSHTSYYRLRLLEIKLSDLGIPKPEKNLPSMSDDFLNFLVNEEFTDFEIVTFRDETIMEEYNNFPDKYIDVIDKSMTSQAIFDDVLRSIKVHKSILLARWKHFRRLIDSGMNEAISNKMFIPEPYSWVRGLVFYLYTDKIDLREFEFPLGTLVDCSGVFLLSNLYEIPQLRIKLLSSLYKKLSNFVIEEDI